MSDWAGLRRVISGGQTGADQGGLIAAAHEGVETGGQAPSGWQTASGPNRLLQALGLEAGGTYAQRTELNVRCSDGTVLIAYDLSSTGSRLTRRLCREVGRPLLEVDLGPYFAAGRPSDLIGVAAARLVAFLADHRVGVLNVAGNREHWPEGHMTEAAAHVVGEAIGLLHQHGLVILAR